MKKEAGFCRPLFDRLITSYDRADFGVDGIALDVFVDRSHFGDFAIFFGRFHRHITRDIQPQDIRCTGAARFGAGGFGGVHRLLGKSEQRRAHFRAGGSARG